MNGSLSQKLGGSPPPPQNIYLGFVLEMMSSIGGEPILDNSAKGCGRVEKFVIMDGQSCETSTSTSGEEGAEEAIDEREEVRGAREETVLESNFETVCDVK